MELAGKELEASCQLHAREQLPVCSFRLLWTCVLLHCSHGSLPSSSCWGTPEITYKSQRVESLSLNSEKGLEPVLQRIQQQLPTTFLAEGKPRSPSFSQGLVIVPCTLGTQKSLGHSEAVILGVALFSLAEKKKKRKTEKIKIWGRINN